MNQNSIIAIDKLVFMTYNEVKIGKTIYCLTSKFEGNKNLNDTLKRLAVKQATSAIKGAIKILNA